MHDLSTQNKAWLRAKAQPSGQDSACLEECRQKIIKAIYTPARKFPDMPRFRGATKVISEYKTATKNLWGTLDLMLTYVERGHPFTNNFGDIDMPFYDKLCNLLGKFAEELQAHPDAANIYHDRFRDRLLKMNHTADIGWGYGDFVHDTVGGLEAELG